MSKTSNTNIPLTPKQKAMHRATTPIWDGMPYKKVTKSRNILILFGLSFVLLWTFGRYNKIAQANEISLQMWGNVEAQYQRRADLIGQLVGTVKGAAKHEEVSLTAITEARARATQVSITPNDASREDFANFAKAQDELSRAFSTQLLAIIEAYPDLKTNKNFCELQRELESTENRIAAARAKFNEGTKTFNELIVTFPSNLIARCAGFERRSYFESDAEAQYSPDADFSY